MKPITLRNIPPVIERMIRKRARKTGSLNKAVISLLEDSITGKGNSERTYADLDHFIGSWTAEEASEFNAALRSQRRIDPDIWKN